MSPYRVPCSSFPPSIHFLRKHMQELPSSSQKCSFLLATFLFSLSLVKSMSVPVFWVENPFSSGFKDRAPYILGLGKKGIKSRDSWRIDAKGMRKGSHVCMVMYNMPSWGEWGGEPTFAVRFRSECGAERIAIRQGRNGRARRTAEDRKKSWTLIFSLVWRIRCSPVITCPAT